MQTRLPSLRGIEAFISAADTLSFRVTAERLSLSVSAVSHRIHVLEEELGLRLFDRVGGRVVLTAAGERFRSRLVPGLKALQQAAELIGSTDGFTLRIATFPMFYAHWLAPRISDFVALHPDARIEVLTLGVRNAGKPDIVLGPASGTRLRARLREGCHKLFDWTITPVCHPDLISKYRIETPSDLAKVHLIELASGLDGWPRWFECAGLPKEFPRKSFVIDSMVPSYSTTFEGFGVALAPTCYVPHLVAAGLVRPFDVVCSYPGGVYLGAAEALESPLVLAFREWVTRQALETDLK